MAANDTEQASRVITLVRHQAVLALGRCYGRTDLPVGDTAQAAELAQRLQILDGMMWTSPASRCRCLAMKPHQIDARLQELDFGSWEGLPWDIVPRAALDAWAADPWHFAPPGGETGAALVARVSDFHAALPPGDHVIITHGGPLKVLVALLRREAVDLLAPPPPPGSLSQFEFPPPGLPPATCQVR